MCKRFLFISFCFLSARLLVATQNEPLTLEVGAGYAQENLRWKSTTDSAPRIVNYRESYKKVRMCVTEACLRTIQYDFYFLAEASYGFPCKSNFHENLTFASNSFYLSGRPKGYQAHSLALFGYEADLTPDRFSHFYLAPLVGYGSFWKKFEQKKNSGAFVADEAIEQQTNTLKETWFGPCIGGGVFFSPQKEWRFELIYLFDWLHLRHSSHIVYNYLTPAQEGFVVQREKDKNLHSSGQLARAKLFYQFATHWQSSFQVDYHYFSTDDQKLTRREKNVQNLPVGATTITQGIDRIDAIEWLCSFLLELSYQF